jgi:adenylyltransferase/sulfurtransferase
MELTASQIERYSRHVLLPDIGGVGQKRWLSAAVMAEVGLGRDAEVVALTYLAAAGVGRIFLGGQPEGLVQREEIRGGIAYGAKDVGHPRVDALRRRFIAMNSDVTVEIAPDPAPPGIARVVLRKCAPCAEPNPPVAALARGAEAALEILLGIARGPGCGGGRP